MHDTITFNGTPLSDMARSDLRGLLRSLYIERNRTAISDEEDEFYARAVGDLIAELGAHRIH